MLNNLQDPTEPFHGPESNQPAPFRVSKVTVLTEVPSLTDSLPQFPSQPDSSHFLTFLSHSLVTSLHPQTLPNWLWESITSQRSPAERTIKHFPWAADTPFIFHLSLRSEASTAHSPLPLFSLPTSRLLSFHNILLGLGWSLPQTRSLGVKC